MHQEHKALIMKHIQALQSLGEQVLFPSGALTGGKKRTYMSARIESCI